MDGSEDGGEQGAVRAFLADPRNHGGAPVEQVETRLSRLFLAGSRVFKLKKALRANFADFSTVERRCAICAREVALNRFWAPSLYLGRREIRRGPDGALAFDGEGALVDCVVEMVRFGSGTRFDRLLARGALDEALTEELADVVAAIHARAERFPQRGRAEALRARVEQIAGAAADAAPDVAESVETWRRAACAEVDRRAARVDARGRHGFVRRGHGDLHLENICLVDGAPTPFDGLEFNEDIGVTDVLYDALFVVADLIERGAPARANAFLGRYLTATRDYSGLALAPLFLSMRHAVRALAGRAEERMRLAAEALAPGPRPLLVAVGGPSGSGKSTLARRIAPLIDAPPGAVILRSDVTRKRLFGVAPETALDARAYAPEVSRKVYRRLRADARRALVAGRSAILDAAFLAAAEREAARALADAAGGRFRGVWLSAERLELERRLAARARDASDADAAVLDAQLASLSAPDDWIRTPGDAAAAARLAASLSDASTPSG